jgi:hypothetical protein
VPFTVTVTELTDGIGDPPGGVPVTDAVLTTFPASRSAWVMVCVPVQFATAVGARVVTSQVIPAAFGSVMVIEPNVV